ncbi:MAG: hypothetical protein AAGC93_29000, partial [Cyanobacteria bacterium P01_F01_bin.53]
MTQNPHARVTPAEVKSAWLLGQYNAKGYLHRLILAKKKAGWKFRITNVTKFCKEWLIGRSTFYKAKAALIKEGLLREESAGTVDLIASNLPSFVDVETRVFRHKRSVSTHKTSVSSQKQLKLKSTDTQEFQDSSTLFNSNSTKDTRSRKEECVKKSDQRKERTKSGKNDPVDPEPISKAISKEKPKLKTSKTENTKTKNKDTHNHTRDGEIEALLQLAKKLGVNINDRGLRGVINEWPDRLETAIACLQEKHDEGLVKNPTRYLQSAIAKKWQPDRKRSSPAFRAWFDKAYQKGLVIASERQGDGIVVLT